MTSSHKNDQEPQLELVVSMKLKEFERLDIIQAVIRKELPTWRAAEKLCIGRKQLYRLMKRFRDHGPAGLISKHRTRKASNQLSADVVQQALDIILERYADFGPTLACEKLRELHNIDLAKETVRRLMINANLWITRKKRAPKIQQPRQRRSCVGELIQIDGSDHDWFEGRAPRCSLLVFIDDATSRLMQLHFTPAESTFSYFEITRAYIEQHGKPLALYSDKASVFRVNAKAATGGAGHTQFARAMHELKVETFCANTSSAKGRVERANLTLQDRLVKEMRLQGISSMAAGNAFAPSFIADFNRRFAKPPKNDLDVHRPMHSNEKLDDIFTWREERCVSKQLTIQYNKEMYLIENGDLARRYIGHYIETYQFPDGHVELRVNDGTTSLPYSIYDKLTQVNQGEIVDNKRLGHALDIAKKLQGEPDNGVSQSSPSQAHLGAESPKKRGRKKKSRMLNEDEYIAALLGKILPDDDEAVAEPMS
jgi:hypothetical protein